jgi:hypothetical protein
MLYRAGGGGMTNEGLRNHPLPLRRHAGVYDPTVRR